MATVVARGPCPARGPLPPGLDQALAHLEQRYGSRAVSRVAIAEARAAERRITTGTSLDGLIGGLGAGAPLAFIGEGTVGKLTLALRVVAGAQADGGFALWIDPTASFDALAAERAGAALDRLLVVRTHARDDALRAAASGLRADGFRLVVVDCGPGLVQGILPDDLAPVLPLVRGSTAALLVISERAPARLALPAVDFAHVAWERRADRTLGYVASASRAGERALFGIGALGARFQDAGIASGLAAERAS